MKIYIILLFIALGQNTKITKPQVLYYNETMKNYTHDSKVRQTKVYDFYNYAGAFAIELKQIDNDNNTSNININSFEFEEKEITNFDGCYPKQRNINIDFQLQISLKHLINDTQQYFTDIATSENYYKVYLIRNDLTLFQIDIGNGLGQVELNPNSQNIKDYIIDSLKDNLIINLNPLFIDDNGINRIYIITEFGGVSFSTLQQIGSLEIKKEDFQQRISIYDAKLNAKEQVIFVACGSEGIDIYDISNDGQVKFLKQLTPQDLGVEGGIIINIDSNFDDTLIYLLDQQSGLLIYEIKDITNIKLKMKIQIPNCKTFDHYQNTFFLVAKTNTLMEYAVEIFINFDEQTYYYNTIYLDEMTINSVNVFQYYAILIGDDGHKIVYHSVYNQFINTKLNLHTKFQENDLLKVKEYEFTRQQSSIFRLLVGLAKYEFKYLEIQFQKPLIECQSTQLISQNYEVLLNSTSCDLKDQNNDTSPFSMCQITHYFNFYSESNPGNKTAYTKMTIIIYVLIIGLIWIIIIGYYLYKRWGYKLEFLNWKKNKLIVNQPFNQEVEMQNSN